MFSWLITNRSLWEQPYLDLWSVPHTLVGVLIAFGARFAGFSFRNGILLSIFATSLWEGLEVVSGISHVETLSNQFSDIIVAQIGFGLVWHFTEGLEKKKLLAPTLEVVIVYTATLLVGWLAFASYTASV